MRTKITNSKRIQKQKTVWAEFLHRWQSSDETFMRPSPLHLHNGALI